MLVVGPAGGGFVPCSTATDPNELVSGLRAIRGVSISDQTDADIVRRSHHNPAAFGSLFDRHAAMVHRFAARRVGETLADDLMSETFLIAFERRMTYDLHRASALPWLYGIVTNLLSRHARTEQRRWRAYTHSANAPPHAEVENDAARIAARVDAAGTRSQLARCLADLSPGDRDVLLLFGFADLAYDEIAAALDIPVGTVRSRLHRARRQMRRALDLPPSAHAADLTQESRHG